MLGRNHIITGVCALGHAYLLQNVIDMDGSRILGAVKAAVGWYAGFGRMENSMLSVCVCAYFIGTLLPDIDNPNSMMGRGIHIFVEHRTWLHSIYPYLVVAFLGLINPILSWMFFGIFVHLFWDSFSVMGNCWFYKLFSDYRKYPNGAKVKKGHKLKLYRAGEWSEYLLTGIIVIVTIVLLVLYFHEKSRGYL